jgi:hypothetical protein
MQTSSRQTRAPINKATSGWMPKAKDFASTQRYLAKQQQARDLQKAAQKKLAPTPPQAEPSPPQA